MVVGNTIHYHVNGQYYGSERFYGQDRSTWRNPDGSCEDGNFWDRGEEVCFRYSQESCWLVNEAGDGTVSATARTGFTVTFWRIDDQRLRCDGPPVS